MAQQSRNLPFPRSPYPASSIPIPAPLYSQTGTGAKTAHITDLLFHRKKEYMGKGFSV